MPTGFPINQLLIPDFARFKPRRQRMISSWSERSRTGSIYDPFFNKCVHVRPGESLTLADIEGPGLVVRSYFTLPIRYHRHLLRNLLLRVYYDGAEFPSVEAPLGDFFALPFGEYTTFSTFFLSCTSGGYLCQFPMPFRRSMRIELANLSDRPAFMIFYQFTVYELEELPEGCPYFLAHWRRELPTPEGVPFTLLERRGSGWYVGCSLQAQALGNFLAAPWAEIAFPQGWGLGTLEGPERIYVDGEVDPSFQGTGHEEFFNTAWYFTRRKDVGLFSGNLCRSYLKGRASALRQHLLDPIPFSSELRIQIDHGLGNAIRADYCACAYWYETPPLSRLPPPPAERNPASWLPHAARFLLLPLLFPWIGASAAIRFLKFWRASKLRESQ